MLLVILTLPAFAQDTGGAITTPGGVDALLMAALEMLIKTVTDITFVPAAAALVVVLTAISKKFISLGAGYIALFWQVVAWVAWVLALHFGYADQFTSIAATLTTVLTAILGLVGSSIGATAIYDRAVEKDIPGIGSARTPTG